MLEEADTMEAGEAASASKVTESAKTKNTVTKKKFTFQLMTAAPAQNIL